MSVHTPNSSHTDRCAVCRQANAVWKDTMHACSFHAFGTSGAELRLPLTQPAVVDSTRVLPIGCIDLFRQSFRAYESEEASEWDTPEEDASEPDKPGKSMTLMEWLFPHVHPFMSSMLLTRTTTDVSFLRDQQRVLSALDTDLPQVDTPTPSDTDMQTVQTVTSWLTPSMYHTSSAARSKLMNDCMMLVGTQSQTMAWANEFAWTHWVGHALHHAPALIQFGTFWVSFLVVLFMARTAAERWTLVWSHVQSLHATHILTHLAKWETWTTLHGFFMNLVWRAMLLLGNINTGQNVLRANRQAQCTWTSLRVFHRGAHTLSDRVSSVARVVRAHTSHPAWNEFCVQADYVAAQLQQAINTLLDTQHIIDIPLDAPHACYRCTDPGAWTHIGEFRRRLWCALNCPVLHHAWILGRHILEWVEAMRGLQAHVRQGRLCAAEWVVASDDDDTGDTGDTGDIDTIVDQRFVASVAAAAGDSNRSLDHLVPSTVSLRQSMVITGPNGSGKTTLMKATLTNLVLAQIFGVGCFRRARIRPFALLDALVHKKDTHDADSLFESEARRVAWLVQQLDALPPGARAFCILDEMFTSTHAADAVACIVAALTHLHRRGDTVFQLSTHFPRAAQELAARRVADAWHMARVARVTDVSITLNASGSGDSGVDEGAYTLHPGISPNLSGAVAVMHAMHFPTDVLEDAHAWQANHHHTSLMDRENDTDADDNHPRPSCPEPENKHLQATDTDATT